MIASSATRYAGQHGYDRQGHFPLNFQKVENGAEAPFHSSIAGNFMIYRDRLETHLLQLFTHPETSEWFSIISVSIF